MIARIVMPWLGVLMVPAWLSAQSSRIAAPPVVLRPGDSLRVVVWRMPELSGGFLVSGDSALEHPVYGGVQVAGLPMSAVRARLATVLERFQRDPQFSIQPLLRVVVGGEVRLPGVYTLPPEATIGFAIGTAGGATERGRLSDVRLVRDGREIRLDLADPGSIDAEATIRSGDRIVVTRKGNAAGALGVLANLVAIAASVVVILRN